MGITEFVKTEQQLQIHHQQITFQTKECLEFVDITARLMECVNLCGIQQGILTVQSQHTTAAILINENEPLLLQDMRRMLERLAPQHLEYLHNDFQIRTVNMTEQEDRNGHAHCKAIFLPTSQIVNVVDGKMELGRWQRIFLLELDSARERTLSVLMIGIASRT